jgi:hypothetical protein
MGTGTWDGSVLGRAGNVDWLRQCGWLRQCRWLSSRTRQPCRDAATASHSSLSIETDSASPASASAARLSLDTAQPKTRPPHDHHAILLRAKPLTHPHTPTHLSLKQTRTTRPTLHQQRPPFICAQESVLDPPRRAGNREGDFHSRGRRHHAHALIGARREAYTKRRVRWVLAARLREAERFMRGLPMRG